ncbi:MAG: hypothetical protein E7320_07895 [Clostridiales bacterium]|nr:hypothetical protein [Clostridiales bacterium]
MINIVGILEKALPVFLMLGLGMLCRKTKLLSREGVNTLKSVAVNITLPAVMFSAFATAEYSLSSISIPVTMFAACLLALFLGFAGCRLFGLKGRLSPFMAAGFEAGMLGYALFAILFSEAERPAFAIVDLGQVLFVFTVYKALLAGKGGLRGVVQEAVASPTVWAIIAGLIVGVSGLYRALIPSGISGIINAVTDFVAAPTSAIILLAIGYDLVFADVRWKETLKLVGLRLAVSAVVLGLLLVANRLLGNVMHTGALLMMLILPPPYVLPIFADVEEERADISSALSLLTLIGILLYVVLVIVFA